MESRSAEKSLISKNDRVIENEYFYRKKHLVEQRIGLTGDCVNDRRRYNNASMALKVKLKRLRKRLGTGALTIKNGYKITDLHGGSGVCCAVEPKVLQVKAWWGDDDKSEDKKFPKLNEQFVNENIERFLKEHG